MQVIDTNDIFGVGTLFSETMLTATLYSPSSSESVMESTKSMNYYCSQYHPCTNIVLWDSTYGCVTIFTCIQEIWFPTFQR